jgi:ABC-type iron transport system FetAB ATPase subunit
VSPAAAVQARIVAHRLTIARGDRIVAEGIDLSVGRGEVVALAGPSGAGKSTLLRCIVRLDEPAAGTVLIDGRDARELDPCELRRRVGLVAQHPVMLPGTVRDNLAYGLRDPAADALRGALEATGLDASFADRAARALSGGEAARVAIARALAREPQALLLDEPTAALDAASAQGVERLIGDLAADGLAILVVTHDAAQADRIAGRVVRFGGNGLSERDEAEA